MRSHWTMPRAKAYLGDCREIVPQLGQFDFIFADPPFNIRQDYNDYEDNLESADYEQFTTDWIKACWNACGGILALHGSDPLCELFLTVTNNLGMPRVAWINWHYRFGQCNRSNWIDSRCHCLVFAKSDDYTWNPDDVLVESDRVGYGDKRTDPTSKSYDGGGKRLPGTVWGVPSDGPYWGRIQGNNKERVEGCPNQLPELYLARLIRAYTNRGDRILDPFCGSGTTACVGRALGRSCVTIDVSETTLVLARDRVLRGPVRDVGGG